MHDLELYATCMFRQLCPGFFCCCMESVLRSCVTFYHKYVWCVHLRSICFPLVSGEFFGIEFSEQGKGQDSVDAVILIPMLIGASHKINFSFPAKLGAFLSFVYVLNCYVWHCVFCSAQKNKRFHEVKIDFFPCSAKVLWSVIIFLRQRLELWKTLLAKIPRESFKKLCFVFDVQGLWCQSTCFSMN